MEKETPHLYVWFDTEFTDLDMETSRLLQIAALITDAEGRPVAENDLGLNLHIRLDAETPVSSWVEEHLKDLLTVCRSDQAIPVAEAEQRLCAYVDRVAGERAADVKQRPILAGNSLHMDWTLARRDLPGLLDRLHYRQLDVTALKLQWQDWLGREPFNKEDAALLRAQLPFHPGSLEGQPHDALYDILASIAELRFYRANLFRSPDQVRG